MLDLIVRTVNIDSLTIVFILLVAGFNSTELLTVKIDSLTNVFILLAAGFDSTDS